MNLAPRQTLAHFRGTPGIGGYQSVLPGLERRENDIAVIPLDAAPAHFRSRTL